MNPAFIPLTDKNGYEYPFTCIPIEKIYDIKYSKAELDYTFALVTISNNAITNKYLIGKVTLLEQLPEKLEREIDQFKPTHLLLYHADADFYIIDKDKLSDLDLQTFGIKH